MADRDQRTERATPRRRKKAREKGQVARSRDLVSVASLGGVILALHFFGPRAVERMASLTEGLLALRWGRDPSLAMRGAGAEALALLLPFFACGAALAAAAGVAQGGVVRKPLEIDVARVDPFAGMRRLFSSASFVELAKNIVKTGAGVYVAWRAVRQELAALPSLMASGLSAAAAAAGTILSRALLSGFLCFLLLAACDYLVERWRFERSIRMTKEEVKDEFKETEGNPQIRAKIRGMMRDLARRRMMQEVPRATVVVTNPVHLAVALRYDPKTTPAPRIVAKGAGAVAERIREIARRHGVPVVEDRPLARTLFRLDLGSFVPEQLYRAVARILAQIYLRFGRPA